MGSRIQGEGVSRWDLSVKGENKVGSMYKGGEEVGSHRTREREKWEGAVEEEREEGRIGLCCKGGCPEFPPQWAESGV